MQIRKHGLPALSEIPKEVCGRMYTIGREDLMGRQSGEDRYLSADREQAAESGLLKNRHAGYAVPLQPITE